MKNDNNKIPIKVPIKVTVESIEERYDKLRRLSVYSKSKFFLGVITENKQRVIKKTKINRAKTSPSHEFDILQNLIHPNIIKVYEYAEDTKYFYTIFERIQGEDLHTLFFDNDTQYPEKMVTDIFNQIITGVRYIHSKGIAHCDLKMDNVMYNEITNTVTIIDFDLAIVVKDKVKIYRGTKYYIPPEMAKKEVIDLFKADIWTLGVTLYCLVFRNYPFNSAETHDDHMDPILRINIIEKEPKYHNNPYSDKLLLLIQNMLVKDPDKRITMDEINCD